MAAGLRAKLRQMQSVQPRLQTKARREKLHAAISHASTAVQAAMRIVQGDPCTLYMHNSYYHAYYYTPVEATGWL